MAESYINNGGWDDGFSSEKRLTPNVQDGKVATGEMSWEDKKLDDTVAKMRQLNELVSKANEFLVKCAEVEKTVDDKCDEVRKQIEDYRSILSDLETVMRTLDMTQNWIKKEVSNTSFELGMASKQKLQQDFAECVQQELEKASGNMSAEMSDFKEEYLRDFRTKMQEVTQQTQKKSISISEKLFWEGLAMVCASALFGMYGIFRSGFGKFIPIVAVLLLFVILVVWLVKLFREFDNR